MYLRQVAHCRQDVGAFDAVESEKAPPHAADIANVKFDADSFHLTTTQRICHTNTKHTQVEKIFANTQLAGSSSMHPGLLFKYKQNESFLSGIWKVNWFHLATCLSTSRSLSRSQWCNSIHKMSAKLFWHSSETARPRERSPSLIVCRMYVLCRELWCLGLS